MKVRFDEVPWEAAKFFRLHIEDVDETVIEKYKAVIHAKIYGMSKKNLERLLLTWGLTKEDINDLIQ